MDRETEAQRSSVALQDLLALDDERFVRAAYRMFLGRDADPEGFGAYLEQLKGGLARLELVALVALSREGLAHSAFSPAARNAFAEATRLIQARLAPEAASLDALFAHHDEAFVRCAYLALLAREPDPSGLAQYVDLLRRGEAKRRVLGWLRRSQEGIACESRRVAVRAALARSPMATEDATLQGLLAQSPSELVFRAHALLAGRRASPQEVALQVNRLADGVPPPRLLAELAQSEGSTLHARLLTDLDRMLRLDRWARLPVVGSWLAGWLGLEPDTRTERRWRRMENELARLTATLRPLLPAGAAPAIVAESAAPEEIARSPSDEVLLRAAPSVAARLSSLPPANDGGDLRARP